MAALVSGMFWLHFCAVGRSRDALAIIVGANGRHSMQSSWIKRFFLTEFVQNMDVLISFSM